MNIIRRNSSTCCSILWMAAFFIILVIGGCATRQSSQVGQEHGNARLEVLIDELGNTRVSVFPTNHERTFELAGIAAWDQSGLLDELCCGAVIEDSLVHIGNDADSLEFSLQPSRRPLPRQFPPLVSFSEGGVIVYPAALVPGNWTGDFDIHLQGPKGWVFRDFTEPETNYDNQFALDPSQLADKQIFLIDPKIYPNPTTHYLIDQGLPADLKHRLGKDIDLIVETFNAIFPHHILHPLVAVHWDDLTGPGLGWDGDAYGNNGVRVRLRGKGAAQLSSKQYRSILKLIAHEIAHLWNAGVVHPSTHDSSLWMLEGGANFLSQQLLRESGHLDEDLWASELSDAINECRLFLATTAFLPDSSRRSDTRFVYRCGQAVFSLIAIDSDSLPMAGWGQLIENAEHGGRADYEESSFFDLWESNGVSDDLITLIKELPDVEVSNFDSILHDTLADSSLTLAPDNTPLLDFAGQRSLAVLHVLRQDCQGRIGMWQEEHYLILDAPNCSSIPDRFELAGLSKHSLLDPHDVLRELASDCEANELKLRGVNGIVVPVECNEPPPDIPQALRLEYTDSL